MIHIFLRTLLAVSLSSTLLTACNKAETPKANTSKVETTKTTSTESTNTTAVTVSSTASTTTKSPTVDMYVTTFKMATVGMLNAKNPLTPTQTTCLLSKEADATYYPDAQAELNTLIGADGIAESDKFYQTEVGKKMLAFIEQQQAKAMGKPITDAPVVITEADKKAIAEFTASNPKMKDIENKMKAVTANPQNMMAKIQKFTTQEQARCQIS